MSTATSVETELDPSISDEMQLGQYIPLHYHFNMLLDADRVDAFRSAIEYHVRPGMRVLELGGGTGILSSFAARKGAEVTCVERNPVLVEKAEYFLRENGLGNQVSVVAADAAQYVPPKPVDVVVCEMLHVALLREKQLDVIAAFKSNYRRAFGADVRMPVFIPEASVLMWQPIQQDFCFAGYWAPIPMFRPPLMQDERIVELGPLDPYASIDYDVEFGLHFNCQQAVVAQTAGEVNAVRFITQNVLAVDLSRQSAVTWPNQCLILPLRETRQVDEGQKLQVQFRYRAGDALEVLADGLQLNTLAE